MADSGCLRVRGEKDEEAASCMDIMFFFGTLELQDNTFYFSSSYIVIHILSLSRGCLNVNITIFT